MISTYSNIFLTCQKLCESVKQNLYLSKEWIGYSKKLFHQFWGCNGRVVKAFDSKSNGIFPRRFESYSQRWCVLYTIIFLNSISLQNWPRWGSNPQSSDSKSDALSIGPRGRCSILNIFDWYLTNAILYHNECKSGFGSAFCKFKLFKVYIDSGCILCTYCIYLIRCILVFF